MVAATIQEAATVMVDMQVLSMTTILFGFAL